MKLLERPLALMILLLAATLLQAQNPNRQTFPEMELSGTRREILLPQIGGYQTIRADLHMHTVFSDGDVWPDVRVAEAWSDGLDAIALTDHDRYHPHRDQVNPDHNAPWKLAANEASDKGLILIPAVEITRKMPPGHFNALFAEDANIAEMDDTSRTAFLTTVEKLHNQGAILIWNHPGWAAQQKDTVRWFEVHTQLLEKGWLQGIEIFNFNEWYPIALGWALEKGLAPMANSDVHGPMRMTYEYSDGFIRPMTIILAEERTPEAIRKAILEKRTIACFNSHVAGSAKWLEPFFQASVSAKHVKTEKGKTTWQLTNHTDLTIRMKGTTDTWKSTLDLTPRSSAMLVVPEEARSVEIEATNWHTGMKECLKTTLGLSR